MKKTPFSESKKTLPKYLTKTEIDVILNQANHDNGKHSRRNYLMLLTLFRTGMRVSDLVNLKKENIKEDCVIVRMGKGRKDRMIPLDFNLRNLLLTYSDKLNKDVRIFSITSRQVNNIIKKYDQPSHAHTFRHSFAVYYLKCGGSIRVLQKILGHAHIGTTEVYLDIVGKDVKEDYNKIPWG